MAATGSRATGGSRASGLGRAGGSLDLLWGGSLCILWGGGGLGLPRGGGGLDRLQGGGLGLFRGGGGGETLSLRRGRQLLRGGGGGCGGRQRSLCGHALGFRSRTRGSLGTSWHGVLHIDRGRCSGAGSSSWRGVVASKGNGVTQNAGRAVGVAVGIVGDGNSYATLVGRVWAARREEGYADARVQSLEPTDAVVALEHLGYALADGAVEPEVEGLTRTRWYGGTEGKGAYGKG